MASGMYYRMYPNRILFKMYGFDKVDPEKEQEIVARLRRHTNASSLASADSMTAFDQEVSSGVVGAARPLKARHPEHQHLCPKSRPVVMKDLAASSAPRMEEYDVQRIFRRLQRCKTFSSEIREAETRKLARDKQPDDGKGKSKGVKFQVGAEAQDAGKKRRPQSAYGRLEGQDEPPDARTACRQFEAAQKEKKYIEKLCRPTAATELKKKGFCYFCNLNRDVAASRWATTFSCQHCGGPGADPEANLERIRQQRSLVRRLRAPTRASEGGLPVCDKAPREATAALLGMPLETPRRPLLSGLPRTRTVRGITARLNRPLSAPAPCTRGQSGPAAAHLR